MKSILPLGFFLLVVVGCAPKPLEPDQARALLAEHNISYSRQAFLAAAGEGDLETVRLFVEAGMDVNAQTTSENDETALMHAAGGGHLKVVKYLVEQGADPDLTSDRCAGYLASDLFEEFFTSQNQCRRQEALLWAAYHGRMKVVEYLIEVDGGGYTPHIEFFYYPNGPHTAISLAAWSGHLNVLKYLRKHVNFHYQEYVGGQDADAMVWAAEQGHLDVVKFLHKEGTPVDSRKVTPLMAASYSGHKDVVEFLLEKGANIHLRQARQFMDREGNVFTEYGASALTLAIQQGRDEIMHILLNHWVYTYGADGHDDHGRTALMYAASWGNMEWAQKLIANGAAVDAKTTDGTTALFFAAAEGHVEIVGLLIDLGADPHARNIHDYTALLLAEERGHEGVASLLRNVEEEQLNG